MLTDLCSLQQFDSNHILDHANVIRDPAGAARGNGCGPRCLRGRFEMNKETTTMALQTETTTPAPRTEQPAPNRRKFLTGAAATAAGATAVIAAPNVSRAQTTTIKMQGAWAPQDILNEFAEDYVARVNEMGGDRLRIDYLVSGAVVKPFSVHDACNTGVLDAGHTVPAYVYGKNKAASLFGTGPCWGWDANQFLGWVYNGGGLELYNELMQDVLGMNVISFFALPMPTQPLGWFTEEITSADQLQGLKYRTVGLATEVFQKMGAAVTQLPGGEIIPAMERGVIDGFEFNNPSSDRLLGAPDVSKTYMMGSYHQANESFEIVFNKGIYDGLAAEQQAILKYAVEAASSANIWKAFDRYSKDLQGLQQEDGVSVHRTPQDIMSAQLDAWDTVAEEFGQDEFFTRVIDSQKEWSKRVVYYSLFNSADYKLAYEHYFGSLGF
jgi:TRAP-type mannitol/chloroaromatic compound transport system substrate-binding protein